MFESKKYTTFNKGNVVEILYRLLGAENVAEGEGVERKIFSTHPTVVAGLEFKPYGCTTTNPRAGFPNYYRIETELKRLYFSDKETFWYGIDYLLGELNQQKTRSSASEKLGKYGRRGLFSALDTLREKADMQHVSDNLKQIVDNKIFSGRPSVVCGFEHEDVIQKVDVHFWAIRALGVLQTGIPVEYWTQMIERDRQYATPAFHGLAFCDLTAARPYLDRRDLGVDKDSAGMSYRAAERFARKK